MKIYGGKRKISDGYLEVKYIEYSNTGEIINEGVEDFSIERYNRLPVYQIWTWDGTKRNKGGKRWFDYAQSIRTDGKPAEIKAAFAAARATFHGTVPAEIDVRKI